MMLALAIPETIAGLFLDAGRADSAAVLALAVSFLFFAALFQLGDGLQAFAFGALRGLNDTAVPMVMVALSYWVVGISVGLGLAFGAGMGGTGIWIGFVVALSCEAALLTARFRRLARTAYLPALVAA